MTFVIQEFIHFFLQKFYVNRVSRVTTPEYKISSSTLTITTFIEIILTNSPADINTVHVINTVLNQLIQSRESLPIPINKYVDCIIRSSERLYAFKIILEKEKEELQAVIIVRKQHLSGKRKIIEDESLITAMRIFE